jgi:hypothetical protein
MGLSRWGGRRVWARPRDIAGHNNLHGTFHIISAQSTASVLRSKGAIQRACFGSLAMASDCLIKFILMDLMVVERTTWSDASFVLLCEVNP